MKHTRSIRRVGLVHVTLAVCLCLFVAVDSSYAKKKRGRGRKGRGRGRGCQMKSHTAKHTGVHIKLGEDKKDLKTLGVGLSDIRAIHERNMAGSGGGSSPIVLSDALKSAIAIKKLRDAEAAKKRATGNNGVILLGDR